MVQVHWPDPLYQCRGTLRPSAFKYPGLPIPEMLVFSVCLISEMEFVPNFSELWGKDFTPYFYVFFLSHFKSGVRALI